MHARVRGLITGAAAAVVVVSAYALGSSGEDGPVITPVVPASASEEAEDGHGTIAIRGTGESTGVPDQLTFRVSVRAKEDDVSSALDEASSSLRRVLAALERADVRRRDVQTTGLSVRPDYAYSSSAPPVLTGYVATQSVSVLVRELRGAGTAIATAAESGGNAVRLSGIRLRIGDREELLADARDAAIAQARAKAAQYAAAAGQQLGAVRSVREVHAGGGRDLLMSNARIAFDRVAAAVPIRAGSQDLAVTVAVVWELQ